MSTPAPPTGPPTPRVLLYSKPGCHLCDDAREVVRAVCADLDVAWDEVDISSDEDLTARYWEQIPVTLVDGRQHDFWRVDARRLRAALTR
jgi:glutaredoxin